MIGREMDQQLGGLAALAEDLGSVPNTHVAAQSHLLSPSSGHYGHYTHTQCTYMHASNHT